MDTRSWMVVGVALALSCTPTEPAGSAGMTGTDSTGGGTDGVASTGGSLPTTGGPAETTSAGSSEGSSAGDTGSSTGDSTGEPVRPGCGDGVLAAGEVCFERTEQDTFTRSFSQMALADLDGDGHLDLVGMGLIACPLTEHDPLRRHGVGGLASALAPSRDGAANLRVETALGDGLGGFTFKAGFEPVAGQLRALLALDVTGDGDVDMVTLSEDHLVVFAGAGDGTMGPPEEVIALPEPRYALAAGDLDGDGIDDLLAVGDGVTVLLGDGVGGFTADSAAGDGGLARQGVVLHDLDDDGDLDAVVLRAQFPEGAVEVLHNDGSGVLTSVQELVLPGYLMDIVVIADAQDGRPVVLGTLHQDVTVLNSLRVEVDGTLAAPEAAAGAGLTDLLVGRFDGDLRADATQLDKHGVAVLVTTEPWAPVPVPLMAEDQVLVGWPLGHCAGDVNEDGVDDVIVADASLVVFRSDP